MRNVAVNDPEIRHLVDSGCARIEDGVLIVNADIDLVSRDIRDMSPASEFARTLDAHREHETFRAQNWVYSLQVGFTCACSGHEEEWRISVRDLKRSPRPASERLMRRLTAMRRRGDKKRRKDARLANIRARALLHQHLTREQRWELRGTKAFTVRSRDGHDYLITEGSANNVKKLQDGRPIVSLCVTMTDQNIPVFDLMLAQKLLLEYSPERFHALANVFDLNGRPLAVNGVPLVRT